LTASRTTGSTRASSSSSGTAGAAGPGGFAADVEHVGAVASAAARNGAAPPIGVRPPSENESGVTLTMPITWAASDQWRSGWFART
jgi:hypothetical protein